MTESSERDQAEAHTADPWERHRRAQLRRWLRLSYRERLVWLEQAKRFAAAALAAARGRQEPKQQS